MPLIITLLLIVFVVILILMQPSKVIYIRLLSIPVLCILFILCLILLSDTAVKSALNGLRLWAGVVVPSLFPFFVAAEIMNSTGFIRASGLLLEPVMRPLFNVPGSGSFALAMGVLSGYPVGAKITCDFRNNGELTKYEAERLLAFTNNSGPLFIVGAVGTGMYGSPRLGIFLLSCHLLACITVGLIFRFYKAGKRSTNAMKSKSCRNFTYLSHISCKNRLHERENRPHTASPHQRENRPHTATSANPLRAFRKKLLDDHGNSKLNFGAILGDAVKNSVSTILVIGGFIVLFSVIIKLLTETGIIGTFAAVFATILAPFGINDTIMKGVLSGLFEITTGSGLVSAVSGIPVLQQLPAASLIIGWAGLSVHFQVMSITAKTDISIRPYLIGKMVQGIISAFYSWLGLKWLRFEILLREPVLSDNPLNPVDWLHTFGRAIWMMLAVLTVFAVLCGAGRFKASFQKQR